MKIGLDIARKMRTAGMVVHLTGRNVAAGWFAINCPWCADPSAHLVVNEVRGTWNCWRCGQGGLADRLLYKLRLPTSRAPGEGLEEPGLLTALRQALYPDNDLNDVLAVSKSSTALLDKLEHEFCLLWLGNSVNPAIPTVVGEYLLARGITPSMWEQLSIRYADEGLMRYRVIFPVWYKGEFVNYLGRDITGQARARYKFCPEDDATLSLSALVYDYDRLAAAPPEILWVCEGVFDALAFGLGKATACFRATMSPLQALVLAQIGAEEYRIVFDRAAMGRAAVAARRLRTVCSQVSVWWLDDEGEDPADGINPAQRVSCLAAL